MWHYERNRAGVINVKHACLSKPDLVEEAEAACECRSGWAVHRAVETHCIRALAHKLTSGVLLINESVFVNESF